MNTVEYWIKHLELQPHPEGGFFKETYRASEIISALPDRFEGGRNFSTAIYFLLRSKDRSVFHRIKSDELWHFYDGSCLSIYVLTSQGLKVHRLGANLEMGESLQVVVPANSWFGARLESPNSFALCGCTVSPGFDFQDFEMADRQKLLMEFPDHEKIITELS